MFPIPISCINRIILSYKLNYDNYRAIANELRSIDKKIFYRWLSELKY